MDGSRGRNLGRRQDSKESRDSSVSSTSREVRCGCQYFQTDSLLPERHTLVGTRPSRPSSRNMGDHEYEPINPPPSQLASPPLLKVTDQEGQEKINEPELVDPEIVEPEQVEPEKIDLTPIINSSKHQYIRIPLDQDLAIPLDKEEVESIRYDDEEETEFHDHEMTAQDIQDQIEERFFAATPTTTISRTDGEFNTSQMDSSGLDELPLKKDARRGFNPRGFQQRIQSQAGRLRTKIRSIQRPKINFPDKSKLHLPERPKFNFPERPKFNLPERPKFNLKRPDIKMPNFNFGKSKSSSIRRPLRDRSQIPSNQSTVGSKKNIFDSINFRTYPRIFSKKKKQNQGRRAFTPPPRMETESTPPSSPASRTGPVNERWTHRFKDIKFADDDNQSDFKKPSFDDDVEDDSAAFRDTDFKAAVLLSDKKQLKAASSGSIPGSDREQQSSGTSSERHRAGVIEEIDSDEFFLREKGLSREDVDVSRYLSLEIRDAFRSPKNALASLDKDLYDDDKEYEFQLNQQALGEPIRLSMEALRNQSSEQMIMPHDHKIEQKELEEVPEPSRPERTYSLKKQSKRSKSVEPVSEPNTSSPSRPSRTYKQHSLSKHSIPSEDYNKNTSQTEDTSRTVRPPSIPSLEITDTNKDLSLSRYIDESSEALNEPWRHDQQPPLPPKRRKSTRDSSLDNESLSAHQYKEQWSGDVEPQDMVLDNMTALQEGQNQIIIPLQNGYYDIPPTLPMRKSRSQGTSLADEDRTSRGADSLISETRTHISEEVDIKPETKAVFKENSGYAVVEKPVNESKPVAIDKPTRPPPPSRKKKTAAQLTALKNQSINFFFTYPRRAIKKSLHKQSPAPLRPVRNYSTIGPSRPPRRNRVFREPVYEGEFIPLKDESETLANQEQKKECINDEKIEDFQDEIDSYVSEKDEQELQEARDLQSGDVIEKMKGRPLPPPPRPPRKSKDFTDTADDDNKEVETTDLDEDVEEVVVERIDIQFGHEKNEEKKLNEDSKHLSRNVFLQDEICEQQEDSQRRVSEVLESPPVKAERRKKSTSTTETDQIKTTPIEATVSTQTDTLQEGFYIEEEQQTSEDYRKFDETRTKTQPTEEDKTPKIKKEVETVVEHKVVVIPTPETEILKAKKIHVTELDVEKLNVTELQAQKITVSDIDGVSMQVTELTSKSGHLVVSGIDLPASFFEAMSPPQPAPPPPPAPIIQIQSSTQTPPQTTDSETNTIPEEIAASSQMPQLYAQPTSTSQKRPSPPPSIVIESPQGESAPAYVPGHTPSSPPPRPLPRVRKGHEVEEELRTLIRRRRHHSPNSTQYSSDDEDEERPVYSVVPKLHREPTSNELIRQLLKIWQASLMRGVNHVVEGLNSAFPEGEKRRDAQTAACIILVLLTGLILLGFGSDKTVHHHHWDFLPPRP